MGNMRITILLAALLALILPRFAGAEDVKPDKSDSVTLDDIVVTATKYETSMKEVPASVTVITGEELKAQNLPNNDIGDALRSVAGITLRRAYSPFPAYINIRGTSSGATIILVNGVPTNWEITQAIPPDNVERIEILRGPASALYGANASGGVVNIITKEGGEGFHSSVGGGFGTFDTWRLNATSNGTVKKFHYSLAAYKEKSDGANVVENTVLQSVSMIDDCDYGKSAVSLTTAYDLPQKGKLSFLYNFFTDEYTRGRPNVGGDWDRHLATLMLDQPIGERLLFKGYVGWRFDDLLHRYDKGGTNYAPRQTRDTDYTEIPVELQLTGRLGFGNTLTGGFFFNRQETTQDYRDPQKAPIGENEYKIRTFAGYLQDVWKPLDDLAVTAGLRFDQWKNYDNTFYSYQNPHPNDRTEDNWSPKIGAKYTFPDTTALWANYSVGFIAPTPEQLYDDRTSGGNPREPNPDLKPETTRAWELGLERWFAGMLRARMTGFYSYTEDKIISWFSKANVWTNQNIGRSRSYGVELDFLFRPADAWTINFNYTYNPAEIDKNPMNRSQEGNELPFSPKHKANLGVTYNWKSFLTLSGFVRYLSEQHTNDDNAKYTSSGEKRFMPSSFVVDMKAIAHIPLNWGFIDKADVALSVDNVFDEDYRTFYIYEDPGRVFFGEFTLFF